MGVLPRLLVDASNLYVRHRSSSVRGRCHEPQWPAGLQLLARVGRWEGIVKNIKHTDGSFINCLRFLTRTCEDTYTSLVAGRLDQWVYEEIGKRISDLRRQRPRKLSQQELADAIGLSRASVVNVERGRHRVQIHLLYEIARVLGVEPQDLLPPNASSTTATDLPPSFTKQLGARERKAVERLIGPVKGDSVAP